MKSLIQLRVEKDFKQQVDEVFANLGLDTNNALKMFMQQVLIKRKIPFEISLEDDGFYSETNMKALDKSIENFNDGKKEFVEIK